MTSPEPERKPAEELDPGEAILGYGTARWRENPYLESPEEIEGILWLTTNRVIFETPFAQPFVSLNLDGFEAAEVKTERRGVQLVLTHIGGERKSFWCDLDLARQVAAMIGRSPAT
jgi:hypothetical protein